MATERNDIYAWKGNPVTLVGNPVNAGDKAPDATLTAGDLSDAKLGNWADRVRVLNVVPSLDTPICDVQTKKFNEEAGAWGDKAVVLTISMDLPFAQKRWCAATDSGNVVTLSDFRLRDFGEQYGVYVKDKGLLARSVFVIDQNGDVKHAEITKDIGVEPDYAAVVEAVKSLI